MSNVKLNYEDCIQLLVSKQAELLASGIERFPQRSDFSEREVVAIKAFLGPWPRALECAGIKEKRNDDKAEKNKEKRIRAKRNRRLLQKKEQNVCKNADSKSDTRSND